MFVGNADGPKNVSEQAIERPKTLEQFMTKWDVGEPTRWLARFLTGDERVGAEDSQLTSGEIVKNGGWIDFYLDYRQLSLDDQGEVARSLTGRSLGRLSEMNISASRFESANSAPAAAPPASLESFSHLRGRTTLRTATLEQFMLRYDSYFSDGKISQREAQARLSCVEDLVLDLANLSQADQVAAYERIVNAGKAVIAEDAAIYTGMQESGELEHLKPLHVDPLADGIKPK